MTRLATFLNGNMVVHIRDTLNKQDTVFTDNNTTKSQRIKC